MSGIKGMVLAVLAASLCASSSWAGEKSPEDVNVLNTVGVDVLTLPPASINGDRLTEVVGRCSFRSPAEGFCEADLTLVTDGASQPKRLVGVYATLFVDPTGSTCRVELRLGDRQVRLPLTRSFTDATMRDTETTIFFPIPIALTNTEVKMRVAADAAPGDYCGGEVRAMYEY